MTDRAFLAQNTAARQRLDQLVPHLRDGDLARPLADGWTIAAALAHLAFWEQYELVRLGRWLQDGAEPQPIDWDAINVASLPQWRALPPREAVRQAAQSTAAVDQMMAALTDSQIDAIRAGGLHIDLTIGEHRTEHLDEIARTLGE